MNYDESDIVMLSDVGLPVSALMVGREQDCTDALAALNKVIADERDGNERLQAGAAALREALEEWMLAVFYREIAAAQEHSRKVLTAVDAGAGLLRELEALKVVESAVREAECCPLDDPRCSHSSKVRESLAALDKERGR